VVQAIFSVEKKEVQGHTAMALMDRRNLMKYLAKATATRLNFGSMMQG